MDPMIGAIGTAPEHEAINCGTPGYHGGNMDTKIIREGAAVYLPVQAARVEVSKEVLDRQCFAL